jgi:DNA modification methylase
MNVNNIYHGDSYELIKEMEDNSIDLIYTDVPYLMQNGGKGAGAFGDRIHKLIREDMHDIIEGFNYKILDDFIRVSKKVNIFIWCNKQQILKIMNYFKDYSIEILFWAKTNASPFCNNNWLPDVEYCLYIREKGVKLNDGYDLKSKWYVSPTNKFDKDLYDHPTIKPLELVKRHILHTTQENDIVFDPFLGSGTTAVACSEIGRKYIGIEKNEEYYNIAVDRLNGITQQDRREKEQGIITIFDL